MDIKDVKAIITGGTSGLGAATARHLSRHGAQVTLLDLADPSDLAATLDTRFLPTDVTDEASVGAALTAARAHMSGLNVVINCAGIATTEKTLGKSGPHSLKAFRKTLDINLTGSFNVARLAAPHMPPGSVILNTASIAAYDGQKGQPAYAASKAGIAGLSLPMARDLARNGIRVMAIAPGLFRTPMLEGLGEDLMETLAKDIPYPHRLGDPDEFAALARFILECDYLNGTTIRLDGALRLP